MTYVDIFVWFYVIPVIAILFAEKTYLFLQRHDGFGDDPYELPIVQALRFIPAVNILVACTFYWSICVQALSHPKKN